MVFIPVLAIEAIFFAVMTLLFEYHWRHHDFDTSALIAIRLWYYVISIVCFAGMALAAFTLL